MENKSDNHRKDPFKWSWQTKCVEKKLILKLRLMMSKNWNWKDRKILEEVVKRIFYMLHSPVHPNQCILQWIFTIMWGWYIKSQLSSKITKLILVNFMTWYNMYETNYRQVLRVLAFMSWNLRVHQIIPYQKKATRTKK